MSWRDAPLYVEAHDLTRWIVERTNAWTSREDRHLAPLITRDACDLLSAVSLALTFPATRRVHLEQADHGIVRLRVLLRVARGLGLLSAGGLRFASGRLSVMGRMVGGWRKRVASARSPPRATRTA